MFITWRKRAVKGDRPAVLLGADHAAPWKPLHCTHRGAGRVAWTPLLMHAGRTGAGPRQTLLRRLPTIRSCCIDDPFRRAAWWHEVERIVRGWREAEAGPIREALERDLPQVLAKLRAGVPPPTPEGVRAFAAYRLRKGQEHRDERARREREVADREAEGRRSRAGDGHPRGPSDSTTDPGCFAALGLRPDATEAELRRRFEEMLEANHPARGGDRAIFFLAQHAFEEALGLIRSRPTAA